MDKPGDPDLRGLRPCRLSARRRGDADRRGRGLRRRDRRHAPPHRRHRRAVQAEDHEGLAIGGRERGDLEGPQIGLRRDGPRRRLHLHGRHDPDRPAALRAQAHRRDREALRAAASPTSSMPATATCIRWSCSTPTSRASWRRPRRRGEDILKLCVEVGGCLTGEHGVGIEKRDLMTLPVQRRRPRAADARARRVRSASGCSTPPRCSRSKEGSPRDRSIPLATSRRRPSIIARRRRQRARC